MRIVVALGGNALLKRGQPMTADNATRQRADGRGARGTRRAGAPTRDHPRQRAAGGSACAAGGGGKPVEAYPLDVLGAQTQGIIGYMIEQELGNLFPFEVPFATLLTMVEVDPDDPGFADPSKFVGPVYDKAEADRLAAAKGWIFGQDGEKWRRVVPSPLPSASSSSPPYTGCSIMARS